MALQIYGATALNRNLGHFFLGPFVAAADAVKLVLFDDFADKLFRLGYFVGILRDIFLIFVPIAFAVKACSLHIVFAELDHIINRNQARHIVLRQIILQAVFTAPVLLTV